MALNEVRHGPFGSGARPVVQALNWCDWQAPVASQCSAMNGGDEVEDQGGGGEAEGDGEIVSSSLAPVLPLGGPFDLILGSELVYAPHHSCLADLVFALLKDHAAAVAAASALDADGRVQIGAADADTTENHNDHAAPMHRRACCIIVQRADRPGWEHFVEVTQHSRLCSATACTSRHRAPNTTIVPFK